MEKTHPFEKISFTQLSNACVIEASAGTGKTWTIERLYIKALLEAVTHSDDKVLNVENILVVTFTNDATDELKERLYSQIEKTINLIIYIHNQASSLQGTDIFITYLLGRSDTYQRDILVLTRALQNFDQASIFTIHGFCTTILRDYPFECQVSSEFELVNDKTEIIKQLILNFMRSHILTAREFTDSIATVMNNLLDLFNGSYTTSLLDRIVNKLPKDLFRIDQANFMLKYKMEIPENINFLATKILEDKLRYKALFLAYVINYLYQHYPHYATHIVSYDELIQKTADVLSYNKLLADKIFNKYPVAFIDEFQDTDILQWRIFSSIYNLSNEGANFHAVRGNLIVVGDPKQAIYRFRGADVDTYIAACRQIKQRLHLVNNYRSHPAIMNFINHLFTLSNQNCALTNSYLGEGIDYVEAVAKADMNENLLPTAAEVSKIFSTKAIKADYFTQPVQIVTVCGATKAIRTDKLFKAMTFEILTLLNARPELKGKIAVLVTKNREAVELVKYFARYGIKAAELKLGNIYATTTAKELYTVLTSLLDLANRRNFILAITSGLFNLELATLADKEGELLLSYQERFFRYQQIWQDYGIFSLLYAILEDVSLDNSSLSNRDLANLGQLAELLNKYSQKINDRAELLFWFKERINKATQNLTNNIDPDSEELTRLENDDEQIIITTQHKAKGLEYEILFCPFFKNNIVLDSQFDFNYQRPFFSTYRKDNELNSDLVVDNELANYIIEKDNKEIHRLNYVALTRAKQRIYIYLKQNTITKATGKYNSREKPDKIAELFGYVKNNPNDRLHPLFNYPEFFGDNPSLAIKDPNKFFGVAVYNRNSLSHQDLVALKINAALSEVSRVNLVKPRPDLKLQPAYIRQSYSGLTKVEEVAKNYDYYEPKAEELMVQVEYKYEILQDSKLSGAVFGTLFHELCEIYPFTVQQMKTILAKYNVDNETYKDEILQMLGEAFNYPVLAGKSLGDFTQVVRELEFNLTVSNTTQIYQCISQHFGKHHPFSLACSLLGEIKAGFLVGFIDLCFECEGKYWVLDYKTNTLSDYTQAENIHDSTNLIVLSMAEHHYYLQYLLYLVALKRYLQIRLKLNDATHLIGGAVYYYVRGIYIKDPKPQNGIFIDDKCQELVASLDQLLRDR